MFEQIKKEGKKEGRNYYSTQNRTEFIGEDENS